MAAAPIAGRNRNFQQTLRMAVKANDNRRSQACQSRHLLS